MLEPGRDIMVANEASAFAESTMRLYRDSNLWAATSSAGLRRIDKLFGRRATGSRLDELVRTLDPG